MYRKMSMLTSLPDLSPCAVSRRKCATIGVRAAYFRAVLKPERISACVSIAVGWSTNIPASRFPGGRSVTSGINGFLN
jgi:hypothetical protein